MRSLQACGAGLIVAGVVRYGGSKFAVIATKNSQFEGVFVRA